MLNSYRGNCIFGFCCCCGNLVEFFNFNYIVFVFVFWFGYFICDIFWVFGVVVVEVILVLIGIDEDDVFNMIIFMGDMVFYDFYYELSRDYVEYMEIGELSLL